MDPDDAASGAEEAKMAGEILPDERSNSMGFFNTADAYWKSAAALEAAKVSATHREEPVRFCTTTR